MPKVTHLTDAKQINLARDKFEAYVGADAYKKHFSAIGQGFKVSNMIGKKAYTYVMCQNDEEVIVGLAYGYREEGNSTFHIADIISAPQSGSGAVMAAWFGQDTNVGSAELRRLTLNAAEEGLKTVYSKPAYGFKEIKKGESKMEKFLALPADSEVSGSAAAATTASATPIGDTSSSSSSSSSSTSTTTS